jgi:hypothetical protein
MHKNLSYETVAYELRLSMEHLISLPDPADREYGEIEDYDLLIYEPTKPQELDNSFLERIIPYNGPEYLNWLGFINRFTNQVDFLRGDLLWPIMSKRMLYVLCSVGDFPHEAIPLRVFDYSLRNELDQLLNSKELPPDICNQDYVALQLLESIDIIDFENSEFEEPDPESILPPKITWLILKEPKEGLPPIFRLARENTTFLYISPAAKEALEESDIRGLEFIAEEGIKAQQVGVAP